MSYDYDMYDGKRIVVDGEIIGLLAMEFGHEVEEVREEYHAELAMPEEQKRQSDAYKESLRSTLSAQYEKVATLETENAKLRELVRWMYDRMDESCAVHHTHAPTPISYDLLMKALARVQELGIEVGDE